ncbi:hypothetical protein INR77_04670 [Erythrobacter sp. SCSIO 43205]|uniref:hypothetical protein n=1 Tax=Erythrobacter sp. SCSIO 43205 TaxID=2779361 RepID=UPI001CA96CD7|nr:hypothetical protein [Erythrobacter sp. SCSIO 43205]UAB78994.1 hypothetical protein INR77_04670 [Erythrobacter sp. SCSIO 43205]
MYNNLMTTASRRTVLIRAEELRALGPEQTKIGETDLDELARIALLVFLSAKTSLEEMSESELDIIFDELLSEEDRAVVERVAIAIPD